MPKTRSFGQAGDVLRDVAHRVERVRDDDQDRVRALRRSTFSVTSLTIFSFVVTRSSRLMPGERGRPAVITTTGAGGLVVAVRPDDVRLVAEHGAHLVDVERLALRQALLDVDEHDVGVVALREHLRAGRADVPGADDRDLPPLAHWIPPLSLIWRRASGRPRRTAAYTRASAHVPGHRTCACRVPFSLVSATSDFYPGLEGVIALRDRDRRARPRRRCAPLPRHRHRGPRRAVPYEKVWGLLVDERLEPGMPDPSARAAVPPGNAPADLQAETARARGRVGSRQAQRDQRRAGARGSRPAVRADDVDRRALGARGRRHHDAVADGRVGGEDRGGEVPASLARRG